MYLISILGLKLKKVSYGFKYIIKIDFLRLIVVG